MFERMDIIAWRVDYLRATHRARLDQRPVCFLDETLVSEHTGPLFAWMDTGIEKDPSSPRLPATTSR